MTTATETELRREATALLGRGISREVWQTLARSGQVELALMMETGVQDIVDAVPEIERRIELERASMGVPEPEPRGNGPDFWRIAAEVVAEFARGDEDLSAIRAAIGLDAPLSLADAVDWILEQHERSEPRWRAEAQKHASDDSWHGGWPRTLTYLVPGQRFAPSLVCGAERVAEEPLDQLALVSAELADRYGWLRSHSTAFVLSDFTPSAMPVQASWKMNAGRPPLITLTIDSRVRAEDVATAYRSVRADVLRRGGRSKPQPQQEVGLLLARFALTRPEGESASASLERWNAEHPEHRRPATRSGAANFGRDMRRAVGRALGR